MVAENAQYWPGVVRAAEILTAGAIGTLVTARAWCCTPFMPQFYAPDGWRFSVASAGGGIAIDAGSHFIRPLRMWCGELDEVVAVTGRPQSAMEGESLCRALIRFTSGIVGSFDAMLAVASGATVPRFQLTGRAGEIVIDAAHVRLTGAAGGAGTVEGESAYLRSYKGEWRDFEAAVLWGATEAALQGSRRWAAQFRSEAAILEPELAHADLAERRVAGRSLSLERAVDLALRVVEEELALGSGAEIRAGGGAAGSADTPRRQRP
jgi:predicted dehydrogenase